MVRTFTLEPSQPLIGEQLEEIKEAVLLIGLQASGN